MTETLHEQPPPPAPPPPRRLARDRDEQVVAGVCGAFGRYTDTDPVLWRVAVAVLALFGGTGIALYVLGWLLVPRVGTDVSAAERLLRRRGREVTVGGVLLLALVLLLVLGIAADGPEFLALVVLAVVGWLVVRERRDASPTPVDVPPGEERFAPTGWSDGGTPPTGAPLGPVLPPTPRQPRSRLGEITLYAAALVTGVLTTLRLSGVEGLSASRIVAAALLVVGAGLLIGTWYGRARWLLAVGVLLAVALGATTAASEANLEDGVGERRWTVTGSDSYRLAVGEGVLDLRGLAAGSRAAVDARVGVGQLTVLVPDDLVVDVVADVRYGEINVLDLTGDDVPDSVAGRRLREEFTVGGPAGGQVDLDLEVAAGEVVLRRVQR